MFIACNIYTLLVYTMVVIRTNLRTNCCAINLNFDESVFMYKILWLSELIFKKDVNIKYYKLTNPNIKPFYTLHCNHTQNYGLTDLQFYLHVPEHKICGVISSSSGFFFYSNFFILTQLLCILVAMCSSISIF